MGSASNQNTVHGPARGTTLNLQWYHGYESAWSGGGSACSTVDAQTGASATNWAAIGCGTKCGMADVFATGATRRNRCDRRDEPSAPLIALAPAT